MENVKNNQHVICTELDDWSGILVDLDTKRYYELNETALMVWKGLEDGQTVDDIAAQVQRAYDVTADHAQRSIEVLMSSFRSYGLVALAQD